MRIFVISRGFPSPRSPQWGCFEKDQAEALAAIGHEVVMLSVDGRFRLYWRKPGLTRRQCGGVTSFDYFLLPSKLPGLLGKKVEDSVIHWQLDKVYRAAVREFGRPDILYSHYLFVTAQAVYLKQKYGLPLVGIEHWSEANKPHPLPHVARMGHTAYPQTDALLAVSASLQEAIKRNFNHEAIVVHNMAGSEFAYHPQEGSNVIRFVSTGSLFWRKGFDLLIDAFARSGISPEAWHLDIIGEGHERAKLQQQIRQCALEGNITLVGSKTKGEIAALLQRSDVFVLPSRTENFSVAVLEALACGLPVVASICGGIRECIHARNGLLFPVDDVDALTLCLQKMMSARAQYNRAEIAADYKARFSPEVIARQLTAVFEDVLARRGASPQGKRFDAPQH